MGFFPTDAIDGDEIGPNANGSYFKYVAADNKWILIPNADVYSEAEVDAFKLNKWVAPDGAVAMGAQKITGLANGVAGTDAMAFGQKYTNANAVSAMGAKGDANPLHHDIYTNSDVQAISINNLSEDASPQLGADLDLNTKSILVNGTLPSDGTYEGFVVELTNAQAFGKAVYISANNTVALCDKDSIHLAIGISVASNKVLILGTVREDDWNWTAGQTIYVGDSGALTNDISAYATGDMVQVVGIAIDPNSVLVKGIDWAEVV